MFYTVLNAVIRVFILYIYFSNNTKYNITHCFINTSKYYSKKFRFRYVDNYNHIKFYNWMAFTHIN
jgi:hypothetical protein